MALQELNGISEKQLVVLSENWGTQVRRDKQRKRLSGRVNFKDSDPCHRKKSPKAIITDTCIAKRTGFTSSSCIFGPEKNTSSIELWRKQKRYSRQKRTLSSWGDFNACSRRDAEFLANVKTRTIDYTLTDNLEKLGFVDSTYKHDAAAKISCPSPVTVPQWSADMETLKSKQYRIDFIFR